MVKSTIKLDIEEIIKRNQAEQHRRDAAAKEAALKEEQAPTVIESPPPSPRRLWKKPVPQPEPEPPAEEEETFEGSHQTHKGYRPPAPQPNMLNDEIAIAAAKKFKQKEKQIQRACAALDGDDVPPEPKQACCVIL